ncbi:MAG: undecaprenyl-diphosphate phosphatase [Candidatus Helarchaeota archaeon]|nr:undecaprenyl-diphosphate phosphatase [Candidatus Helarchaeota archaeon]
MELGYYKSVILGVIQGLTEFLPISSSGHIVIAKKLFLIKSAGMLYEVFLHFGTFLSVIVIFRKEIADIVSSLGIGMVDLLKNRSLSSKLTKNQKSRLGIFIIIASVPAGTVGILFKSELSEFFENPLFVAIALIFTGIILYITKYFREGGLGVRFFGSIVIGCAQAFAILPGISRSGMTISAGIFLGINREDAVKFSFFLSMPAIFGATILETLDAFYYNLNIEDLIQIFLAFLSAFLSGYFAVKVLMKIVIAGKFYLFSFYCFLIGILAIVFYL